VSRVKFLGGIGLLMVCGNRYELMGVAAPGGVVKRCALGPVGRPSGDKPGQPPLAGSEVPGQGPVTRGGHVCAESEHHAASWMVAGVCR